MTPRAVSLIECCELGYHFCRDCWRITEVKEDYLGVFVCASCGSQRVRWNDPICSPGQIKAAAEKASKGGSR
jgi:hypothetical protein